MMIISISRPHFEAPKGIVPIKPHAFHLKILVDPPGGSNSVPPGGHLFLRIKKGGV